MAVMDGCESQHRTSVIEERVCPKCGKEVDPVGVSAHSFSGNNK